MGRTTEARCERVRRRRRGAAKHLSMTSRIFCRPPVNFWNTCCTTPSRSLLESLRCEEEGRESGDRVLPGAPRPAPARSQATSTGMQPSLASRRHAAGRTIGAPAIIPAALGSAPARESLVVRGLTEDRASTSSSPKTEGGFAAPLLPFGKTPPRSAKKSLSLMVLWREHEAAASAVASRRRSRCPRYRGRDVALRGCSCTVLHKLESALVPP